MDAQQIEAGDNLIEYRLIETNQIHLVDREHDGTNAQ